MHLAFLKRLGIAPFVIALLCTVFTQAYADAPSSTIPPQKTTRPHITLKIGHTALPSIGQDMAFRAFSEAVSQESNGRMAINIQQSSRINDSNAAPKALPQNLHITTASTSALAMLDEKWQVFELPYLLRESSDTLKLFYEKNGVFAGPVYETLAKSMRAKGLHMLWVSPVVFRAIGTTNPDARFPSSLKGLNIRATGSPIERDVLAVFGINPVAMPLSECSAALEHGVIDGLGLPADSVFIMNHHSVIKSLIMNNYHAFMFVTYMNADLYDTLPPWAKEAVDKGATAAMLHSLEMWDNEVEEIVEQLKRADTYSYFPTDEEWPLWHRAVQGVRARYEATMDANWLNMVQKQLGY